MAPIASLGPTSATPPPAAPPALAPIASLGAAPPSPFSPFPPLPEVLAIVAAGPPPDPATLAMSAGAEISGEAAGEPEADAPPLSGTPPTVPPPWSERYFPFLEDESEEGSVSVGDTSFGYLIGARRVTESDALAILPRQRGRDLGYGTGQITLLLEDAARKLQIRTRTRFWIGNIGRRGGGDIPYSVSHNSGRDADVALAYTDPKGVPVDPPDLVQVDAAGVSRDKEHKYRFDVARTWHIIKALIESDKAQLEFLFLARPLTEKVLRHARENKDPVELIERASLLLHQPAGAPHDDHVHVRVYCSERDVEGGCLNGGQSRPWARFHFAARARRIEKSVAALTHTSPEQRARGVERLVLLQARDHKDAVTARLDDAESRVRAASASALAQWGAGDDAALIARKLRDEADPIARAAMMAALADLGGPAAGELFATALGRAGTVPWGHIAEAASQPTSPTPFLLIAEALSPLSLLSPHIDFMDAASDEPSFAMKLYIIDAAGYCDRPEPVPQLIELLGDSDPAVRAHAASSLSRLLNRPVDAEFQNPAAPPRALLKARIDLTRQASPLRRGDRSSWMVEGFTRAGFKVPKLEAEHAWEILRAFGAGEPYSYNAARALSRVSLGSGDTEPGKRAPRPPVFEETGAECRYWLKWLLAHRGKLHLAKEPDNIGSACK